MARVQNIYKRYGDREVLQDFSAEFLPGVTVIMGPSGRGKTTLMRLMMGLEIPDNGQITAVPARMAAVFQEDRLPMDFKSAACVAMTAEKGVSRGEIERDLELLGLGDELNKPVRELSGGQRRRVAVARAVLARPDILFLDEAFTGLDGEIKKTVAKYILDNTRGKVLIAVTHDPEEAELLGGRILNM